MFILGENVATLEKKIAQISQAKYGIGVANGSDALYLTLLACGIGPGDEVITTPFTFFSTAGSISRTGATPVFVDICAETMNIDPSLIEEKITSKTKAILPVHLYGCPAEMDEIAEIAKAYHLKVIEDAAQAIVAEYKKKKVGSLGDACCFSFFPTKNLGSFGDAGMVVTNDEEIAEKIKVFRVHGAKIKYYHDYIGCNSRLDELQAAILNKKLKYLPQWTERRREIAGLYTTLLQNIVNDSSALICPTAPDHVFHVYHQYTIRTDRRDELKNYLSANGIGTAVYYPVPLHLQKAFAHLGYKQGDFEVAEKTCTQVLSLPMYPELTDEEINSITKKVADFFA
ncbi:MAG: DegT/DnrJ/EryC1/StrS family aminotransferase [Firmicutes bacterium]|nr:DegT/DnrJ/EryC1/StrS family aminotransferase [Bacillota bacterium]